MSGRLVAWVVLVTLALMPASGLTASPRRATRSRGQLQSDLGRVKREIRQKRDEIRKTRRQERQITVQIEAVEGRIEGTEERLEAVRSRLSVIRERRRVLLDRIAETERRLAGRRRTLGTRIRQNYQRGRTSYLHVALGSRSMQDYLSRSYYVERLVETDVTLVRGMREDRRQLVDDKSELESEAREQQALRDELRERRSQYRADVDEKRDLLHEVHQTRSELERMLDVLEESSHDIESRIRALSQTPRGRVRMLKPWRGSFIKPASGPVTSGFGMRYHPILHRRRMHTGVDIGAGYGSPIHAAAGGEVIVAAYNRGYGKTVIIDHGGGVTTLYGHCSALVVNEGQTVHQGQVIARVGSTGLSTGPHLHFEVRHNGTPVSPE